MKQEMADGPKWTVVSCIHGAQCSRSSGQCTLGCMQASELCYSSMKGKPRKVAGRVAEQ